MKIDELRGKVVVIKCATQEEMKEISEFLKNKVPWTYVGCLYNTSAFTNGFVFLVIGINGDYTNYKGDSVNQVKEPRMMGSDFIAKYKE